MTNPSKSDDEEDYDELPPITVNSSGRDMSMFTMPCAASVAAERARAQRCEEELARLREEHPVGAPPGSDSSGSESEAALVAAVTTLQVREARVAAPRLHELLPAAARHLPPLAADLLQEYACCAVALPPARAAHLARQMLSRLESWLWCEEVCPAAEESAGCTVWLCLALASGERDALGAACARAAHRALSAAPPAAAALLPPALLAALPGAHARLRLADALRGAGARGEALATELVRAALAALLGEDERAEERAVRWRKLPAPAQCTALQLAARARHCPATAPLLAALTAAHPAARDRSADTLKVLVAAAEMQVLFPVKK